jgi:hypothetical protein
LPPAFLGGDALRKGDDESRFVTAVVTTWNRRDPDAVEDTTRTTKAGYVWAESNGSGGLPGFGVADRNVELAVIDTGDHEEGEDD